jgi:hypothetical protein
MKIRIAVTVFLDITDESNELTPQYHALGWSPGMQGPSLVADHRAVRNEITANGAIGITDYWIEVEVPDPTPPAAATITATATRAEKGEG